MKRLLFICVFATILSAVCTISSLQAQNEQKKESIKEGQDDSPVFTVVEYMPEFKGGDKELRKFINETLQYPSCAIEKELQGRVIVNFVVQKDGSITDAEVVRGIDPALDEEALRIINSMPAWEPGKQRGEVVKVRYTLPIVFRLP